MINKVVYIWIIISNYYTISFTILVIDYKTDRFSHNKISENSFIERI